MTARVSSLQSAVSNIRKESLLERAAISPVLNHFRRLAIGRVDLRLSDGRTITVGEPGSELRAELRINDPRFFLRCALGSDIGFGESYMEGEWEADDLTRLLEILALNMEAMDGMPTFLGHLQRGLDRARHFLRKNTVKGSRRNIAHHYDLSNDFYRLFLDETMTYSGAIFRQANESLKNAQLNKIRALIEKAALGPDDHLLEIGSGWGALAIEAARSTGCRVTTVTISREQYVIVLQRVREAGLEDRITPLLCDYRQIDGKFDKIISVEMIEAVGHEYLGQYFRTLDNLLKPGGRVALQVITIPQQRYDLYRRQTDWIQKYIFPGAVVPSLTALSQAMTRSSSLEVDSVESIGLDYARTLREWRERFNARLAEVRQLGFDDRFCRMWEYYLCYCEAGFSTRATNNLQLVLSRPGTGPLSGGNKDNFK